MTDARAKFRIEGEDATAAAFRSALGNAQKFSNQAGNLIKGSFAGIGGAVIAGFARSVFDAADAMSDAARRADVSIESFSKLAYAAKQADLDFGTFESGIARFSKTLGQLQLGLKSAKEAFAPLNLAASDFAGLSLEQSLGLVSDRMMLLSSSEKQAAVNAGILGRGMDAWLPLMRQGSAEIKKVSDEAYGMSRATRAGIDAMDSGFKRLWDTVKGFSADFMGGIALSILGAPSAYDEAVIRVEAITKELEKAKSGKLAWGELRIPALRKQLEEASAVLDKFEKEKQKTANDLFGKGAAEDAAGFASDFQRILDKITAMQKEQSEEAAKESYDAWVTHIQNVYRLETEIA